MAGNLIVQMIFNYAVDKSKESKESFERPITQANPSSLEQSGKAIASPLLWIFPLYTETEIRLTPQHHECVPGLDGVWMGHHRAQNS
jgi:hypothetical protein